MIRFQPAGSFNRLRQSAFTLVEALVFIVVIGIGLTTVLMVFGQNVMNSVDPVVRVKALDEAQALLDSILARKFDENTPNGGVPACDSTGGIACLGITADTDYDDVGDYNGFTDNSNPNFAMSVSVLEAGTDMGLAASQARLITVTVNFPGAKTIRLSAYKVNF